MCTLGQADRVEDLLTPALVVEQSVLRRNAEAMLQRADRLDVTLRPHVKTHKTLKGALLQTGGRRSRIVVSTLRELEFFLEHGFMDVLYAVPLGVDKIPRVVQLHLDPNNDFQVLIDSSDTLQRLQDALADAASTLPLFTWLKVDCGYHRAGLQDPKELLDLAKKIDQPTTALRGLYTHAGMSYSCRSAEAIQAVAEKERDIVVGIATMLREHDMEVLNVAVGSTPTCSHPPESGLPGITEIHPGNYLFYDEMQAIISSCTRSDIAAFVATRVIGVYPTRNHILIDLGWTATSTQGAAHNYGGFVDHPNLKIVSMSQETSVVTTHDDSRLPFDELAVGTMLKLRPYHACATCAMHTTIHIADGQRIVDVWRNECR